MTILRNFCDNSMWPFYVKLAICTYAHIGIEQTNRQTNRHKQYLIHGGTDLHILLFVETCFNSSKTKPEIFCVVCFNFLLLLSTFWPWMVPQNLALILVISHFFLKLTSFLWLLVMTRLLLDNIRKINLVPLHLYWRKTVSKYEKSQSVLTLIVLKASFCFLEKQLKLQNGLCYVKKGQIYSAKLP